MMFFKNLFLILSFLSICIATWAQEVEVEVNPKEPLVGETFNLNFKVKSTGSSDADISFNPYGAEVVGRQNQGISIKTMFVNGRLSTSKEINYSYDLVAQRVGVVRINDIVIDIGGQVIKKPSFSINILREPKELPPVLALAIADKSSVYVGEGFTVRYYLYYKTGVLNTEIKEFPKLSRFFKRFLQENNNPERTEYEGEVYNRSLVYSARLFADKDGKFFVDPITLRVQYQERSRQDPFGGLGMGFGGGKMNQKNVSSRSLDIEVKKLPAENVPPHFTGLVGKHSFDLNFTKTKFLVNEPVEFKLKVTGPGNLESFDAPKLLTDPSFEEFETNSDLSIETDITASKSFDYTYLGRSKTVLKASSIPFSYFNPENGQYVTVSVNLPEITLEGEGSVPAKIENSDEEKVAPVIPEIFAPKKTMAPKIYKPLAPIFEFKAPLGAKTEWINLILGIALLMTILLQIPFGQAKKGSPLEKSLKELQKKGLSYQNLHAFFELASQTFNQKSFQGINDLVQEVPLSTESKRYFSALVEEMEKKEFYDTRTLLKQNFEKKAFQELLEKLTKESKNV
ncbi:MAG: BatD family protein [Bacteriovoracaceae bacterium]